MKFFRVVRLPSFVLVYVPWVLGIFVCLLLFNGALNNAGNSLNHLASTCNLRLLHSVRTWTELGFWQLGGLMSFRDSLTPLPPPNDLYSSQSTLYIIPHFVAYQLGGIPAFWQMIRASGYVAAFGMFVGVAVLAWLIVEERLEKVRAPKFLLGFVLFASFAVTFPNEGVWGGLWNSDDRALSAVLVALASASLALGIRLRRHVFEWLSAIFLVIAAIGCPRMGFMCLLTVLLGRYSLSRKESSNRSIYSWPMAISLMVATALHYIRVGLVDLTGRYVLSGSSMLNRFGLNHKITGKGQSDLDYDSIWQAFGFAWRQSELVIDQLSLSIHLEHLFLYLLAALGLIGLFFQLCRIQSRYLGAVVLTTAPPLIWGVLINQSVAEHPDIHAIAWAVPFALGLVMVVVRSVEVVRVRFGLFWSITIGAWASYWLFLWQVQYFLRAYPALRIPYPR